jgi:hypothetical protein
MYEYYIAYTLHSIARCCLQGSPAFVLITTQFDASTISPSHTINSLHAQSWHAMHTTIIKRFMSIHYCNIIRNCINHLHGDWSFCNLNSLMVATAFHLPASYCMCSRSQLVYSSITIFAGSISREQTLLICNKCFHLMTLIVMSMNPLKSKPRVALVQPL